MDSVYHPCKMRKIFSICFLLLFCLGVGKAWHYAKDGFSIQRVRPWNAAERYPLSLEAKKILNQSFKYIARGHQCYAFASEDGKYVLKLPRTDKYQTPFWAKAFPQFFKQIEKGIKWRENFVFKSFQIAYEELHKETALIAFRTGSDKTIQGHFQVIDRLGRKYTLPIGKTAFLLQKKMPILMRVFEDALAKGDRTLAARILDSFIQIIYDRASKGIFNKDPSFKKNFGFDGEKAYQIDVGSFYRQDGMGGLLAIHKAVKDTIDPVRKWLKTKDPELVDYLNVKIDLLVRNQP